MLVLADVIEYSLKVTVRWPGADPQNCVINVAIRHDFFERLRQNKIDAIEMMNEAIVGWSDVVDIARAPVPFSAEALRKFLGFPWFRDAVDVALAESLKTMRGNSSAPPGESG